MYIEQEKWQDILALLVVLLKDTTIDVEKIKPYLDRINFKELDVVNVGQSDGTSLEEQWIKELRSRWSNG